jgi:ribosomal protein L7Ae-like RNA K-turn-binding protein
MDFDKPTKLLQMAYKARNLVLGRDAVLHDIASKKVYLVVLSTDLAQNSIIAVQKSAEKHGIEIKRWGTKDLYLQAFGKYVGIIGINDKNFKNGLLKHLEALEVEA